MTNINAQWNFFDNIQRSLMIEYLARNWFKFKIRKKAKLNEYKLFSPSGEFSKGNGTFTISKSFVVTLYS